VLLYVVFGLLGALMLPPIGLAVFVIMPIYYAVTSHRLSQVPRVIRRTPPASQAADATVSASRHVPKGDRVGGADLHAFPARGATGRDDHWAQWSCPQSALRAGAQAGSAGGARRADR
jgi:hypothetical protein